jgi:hypothetical protein
VVVGFGVALWRRSTKQVLAQVLVRKDQVPLKYSLLAISPSPFTARCELLLGFSKLFSRTGACTVRGVAADVGLPQRGGCPVRSAADLGRPRIGVDNLPFCSTHIIVLQGPEDFLVLLLGCSLIVNRQH